jgi:hypothetical protein
MGPGVILPALYEYSSVNKLLCFQWYEKQTDRRTKKKIIRPKSPSSVSRRNSPVNSRTPQCENCMVYQPNYKTVSLYNYWTYALSIFVCFRKAYFISWNSIKLSFATFIDMKLLENYCKIYDKCICILRSCYKIFWKKKMRAKKS